MPVISEEMGTLGAALAYAEAGWYVLPVESADKRPARILGKRWQDQSSRDPEQLLAWFAAANLALGVHVGRSGAVVFDVDDPGGVPDVLRDHALSDLDVPHQSTRTEVPGRGHYVFALPKGVRLGNGTGGLGKAWGEVRGTNGLIVVEPSEHSKPGGRYAWERTGPVPVLPQDLLDLLPRQAGTPEDAATDSEVEVFLDRHTGARCPGKLQGPLTRFARLVESGGSRHDAAVSVTVWAMREAAQGKFPAREAAEKIRDAFLASVAGERGRFPRPEFRGILAWAVAQVPAAPEQPGEPAESGATEPAATEPSSWAPVDLTSILDGTHEPLVPTLLTRADGRCLLYAGRVHSLHGESESGKSMVAQVETASRLRAGERVIYLDYESSADVVVGRLLLMGVEPGAIRSHLDYLRPELGPEDGSDEDKAAWRALLSRPASLVVVDGVTEALSTMSVESIDNDAVTGWMRAFPRYLARSTGAAVVLVDHVTKSNDGRGRFAIGAQAKMSALDGAAYGVEVVEPLGRGLRGSVRLWVGKDREGAVRPHCGKFRPSDRTQHAATVVIDSTSGQIVAEVLPPDGLVTDEAKPFRPTHLMERISKAVESSDTPLTSNALTKSGGLVPGNVLAKQTAIAVLVHEGYLRTAQGPRNSTQHTSARPYRLADDPAATGTSQ